MRRKWEREPPQQMGALRPRVVKLLAALAYFGMSELPESQIEKQAKKADKKRPIPKNTF
jgi:hypothetical protein